MIDGLLLPVVIILLCVGAIINKKLMGFSHPFTVQWIQSIFNILLLPVWWKLAQKYSAKEIASFSTYSYAILGSIISSVAFVLFLTSLKTRPVSVAAAYLSIYPALTLAVCAGLGIEKITMARVLGIGCILAGVVILQLFDSGTPG